MTLVQFCALLTPAFLGAFGVGFGLFELHRIRSKKAKDTGTFSQNSVDVLLAALGPTVDADKSHKEEAESSASMGVTEREVPQDVGSFERYKLQEWLTFITNEVHKNFSPLFQPVIPDDVKNFFRDRIIGKFKYIDGQLAGNDYLTGEQFTVADSYLFVMLTWADRTSMDLSALRNLMEFKARVGARPKVQETLMKEDFFEGGLIGRPGIDISHQQHPS
jgi:glutathione S-transferase